MLIELLIVGLLVTYLHTQGIIDVYTPFGMSVVIALLLSGIAVGVVLTRGLTHWFTESMFGFGSWSPQEKADAAAKGPAISATDLLLYTPEALHDLCADPAGDPAKRRLALQEFLRRRDPDAYLKAAHSLLALPALPKEEAIMLLNRMADIEQGRGNKKAAQEYLQSIVDQYPDSVESHNARKRLETLNPGQPASPTQS